MDAGCLCIRSQSSSRVSISSLVPRLAALRSVNNIYSSSNGISATLLNQRRLLTSPTSSDISVQAASDPTDVTSLSSHDGQLDSPERKQDDLFLYVNLEARSHDKAVLKSYEIFVVAAAKHLEINVSKLWTPKTILWRKAVLKDAFSRKDFRVQYETHTNFRCIQIKHVTGSTADTFLEYVERNLPEGVGLKVTKCSIHPLADYIMNPIDEKA